MFLIAVAVDWLLLQQLSDKNIATIVEMGFTIQQATTALQHAGGNLDAALTSLLPPDDDSGQPAPSSREPRTAASTGTPNGPSHRSDRTETRSRYTPADSSYNDRTGMMMYTYLYTST